jgi:hypothetical protein
MANSTNPITTKARETKRYFPSAFCSDSEGLSY